MDVVSEKQRAKKPDWLKVKIPIGQEFRKVKSIVDSNQLHTICQSGNCPNIGECWGAGTATFMILGNICTRSCSFCAVATGRPKHLDEGEPLRVAEAIRLMGVKHAVITSVNRDELPDKGARIWHETVVAIKDACPNITIETLIPDVNAHWEALETMISAGQEVVSHNMETVKRLYRKVRPQAKYERSLEELKRIKDYGKRTKTGIMLGCGETEDEIYEAMDELLEAGVDVLTLGQYLQPTKMHLNVDRYVHPDEFKRYEIKGLEMGFMFVESGPLVRSSYHAEKHVL